jgi:hypothetical protein
MTYEMAYEMVSKKMSSAWHEPMRQTLSEMPEMEVNKIVRIASSLLSQSQLDDFAELVIERHQMSKVFKHRRDTVKAGTTYASHLRPYAKGYGFVTGFKAGGNFGYRGVTLSRVTEAAQPPVDLKSWAFDKESDLYWPPHPDNAYAQ